MARPAPSLLLLMLAMLAFGAAAAVADTGVNISAVEGQPFSGRVLSTGCAFISATIDWGDGTPMSGGRDAGSPAGVAGDHTYAEEGTYTGTVSYRTDCNTRLPLQQQFQATVADAQLTATAPNPLSGSQDKAVSTGAHFTDANPGADVADFSAQVHWGDGTTTTGTVMTSSAGGFDVLGTHSYAAGGSFSVSVSIADVGGATTTSASSTAQITGRAPPPLPPPFNIKLAVPVATFGFSPTPPCQSQYVNFDASGSTGGISSTGTPLPITQFRWSLDESAFAPTMILTTTAGLRHAFLPSSYGPGPYEGTGPNPRGNLFDYRFYRPPAMVTLEVTDSAGKTGSVTQRITFRDPVRILPEIVPLDPLTGLPDFSHAHLNRNDPRFKHSIPCAKLPVFKLVAAAKLKLGRIRLGTASGTVKPTGAAIAVRSPCTRGLANCFGELIVTAGTQARRANSIASSPIRRLLARSLGHTTFFVRAGRTATVSVKLNARGTALARAHKLRTVTLELRSLGSNGKLVTTTRAVRLRFR